MLSVWAGRRQDLKVVRCVFLCRCPEQVYTVLSLSLSIGLIGIFR